MSDDLFIGVKGSVVRIDRNTGKIIWNTHLKSSQLTTLVVDGDLIIAHTRGELYGVRKDNGHILWKNPLTGFGYGPCIIATKDHNTEVANVMLAQQQAAAASGGASSS